MRPFSTLFLILLATTGCSTAPEPLAPATTEASLAAASGELAVLLADPHLRHELRARLTERAEDGYQLSFADAAGLALSDGRTLGEALESTGAAGVDELEIAAPLGLDAWTDATIPLVTFAPADDEATELTFFDGSGRVFTRPAAERPTEAVLVLRVNERHGESASDDQVSGDSVPRIASSPVYLRELTIWDAHDGWFNAPEIYLKCTGVDKIWLDNVDETGHSYSFNKFIRNLSDSEDYLYCKVMESDDDSADDFVGEAYISFNRLQASTATVCYGHSDADALLGVAKVKGTTTISPFGTPITIAAGCPFFYF